MNHPFSIGSRVITGVWVCNEFRPMKSGTVIGYDSGTYTIQRNYCRNGKPCINLESYNNVFLEYEYICPRCGRTVKTHKRPSELKTCNGCGHQTVSTVLFEE